MDGWTDRWTDGGRSWKNERKGQGMHSRALIVLGSAPLLASVVLVWSELSPTEIHDYLAKVEFPFGSFGRSRECECC